MSLLEEEKKEFSSLVGKFLWPPLGTAVARLYFCKVDDGTPSDWVYSGTFGAVFLVVDRSHEKKPRRIQLWCLKTKTLMFQQELFAGMKYDVQTPNLHAFEIHTPPGAAPGVSCLAGLCFCNTADAQNFSSKVMSNIPVSDSTGNTRHSHSNSLDQTPQTGFFSIMKGLVRSVIGEDEEKQVQISNPTNFKHTQHIGYDPDNGFDLSNMSDEMINIFKMAGVKKKDLTNPETAKILYQQVKDSMPVESGINRKSITQPSSQRNSVSGPPPALPPRGSIDKGHSRKFSSPPKHVPSMNASQVPNQPGPPTVPKAPGPPMVPSTGPLTVSIAGPPIAALSGPPLAVVAGPPITICSAPPLIISVGTPSSGDSGTGSSPGRADLLASIQAGKKLKPIAEGSSPVCSVTLNTVSPSNNVSHLEAIRTGGGGLRKSPTAPIATTKFNTSQTNDLISKIQQAMAGRRGKMQDDEDDEDW